MIPLHLLSPDNPPTRLLDLLQQPSNVSPCVLGRILTLTRIHSHIHIHIHIRVHENPPHQTKQKLSKSPTHLKRLLNTRNTKKRPHPPRSRTLPPVRIRVSVSKAPLHGLTLRTAFDERDATARLASGVGEHGQFVSGVVAGGGLKGPGEDARVEDFCCWGGAGRG